MRPVTTWLALSLVAFGAAGAGCNRTPELPEVSLLTGDGEAAQEDAAAPADTMASELREKLVALAVASECLRKNNTPPDQAASTMLTLYKAHSVDLETYTKEMSKLANDAAFQAEVDKQTAACPSSAAPDATSAEVAADTTVAAADGATATTADTTVAAAETGAPADAAPAETTPDTSAAPEVAVAEVAPADTVVAVADTFVPADTTVADTTVADTKTADATAPEVTPTVSWSGNWTGQLYGAPQPGMLRVSISGHSVSSAVATFGRTTIRLRGTMSERGTLTLGGTSGSDFVRMTGTVHPNGRVINGTWDGVVDRKRGNGHIQLKR